MSRTYGTLRYGRDQHRDRGVWGITCEPHVAIRLKRLFARIQSSRTGLLTMYDTPEVALDLEWFLDRYPLDMSTEDRRLLTASADRRRAQEDAVLSILDGNRLARGEDFLEAARPLREYQETVSDMVWATRRLLLTDDVGLGKTTSALGLLRNPDCLPAAFVTLTDPLPAQMRAEMGVVLPQLTGHVLKKGQPYDIAKTREMRGVDPDVVFLSYSKLAGWADALAGKVRTVIFDEVQELRRDGSNRYVGAGRIADAAEYVLGMTATPVYNYGGEMFNVMSVLSRDALGTRDEFVREWGGGITTSGQIRVKEPGSLGHYLIEQGLMLGRTRKDVGREVPPVAHVEQTVSADAGTLDKAVRDIADLASLLLDPETSGKQRFLAGGEIDYKLRHATGVAKAPFVAEFVKLLLESEDKIVVYAWHRDVYDILMRRLADYRPVMFTGSESPKQKQAAKDAFLRPTILGGARVLLMSLRAGAGLDGLQYGCSCVVFAELDWSRGIHIQAVGRVARDGQENPVLAYFLHSEDGSDPALLEVLNVKAMQADPMVRPNEKHDPKPSAEVDGDRARRLAVAALARAGRELPADVLEPAPADLRELFADVVTAEAARPGPDQLGLFE